MDPCPTKRRKLLEIFLAACRAVSTVFLCATGRLLNKSGPGSRDIMLHKKA
jgi:hypothetical protein